jgi:serine/threonine protein kinase
VVLDSNELLDRTLGHCVLQRLLGRGGMGAVYLAHQSRPKRLVAVKVLMPGTLIDDKPHAEFLARFRREADAVAALDHINIMPIYEYGEEDELAYLVMPYVAGGTLRDRLEQHRILPMDEIVSIVEQVAAGLDCAHAQGIVHRDLKPGNILFHADGRVLIADFGLAKVIKDTTDLVNTIGGTLTSTGTIVGTPEYLSPEQGTGNPVDYRSDVYSLGVVLFQMLTGRVPFTGSSAVAVAIKHALEAPPLPSQLNPSIPHSVEAVVMKALAKKPEQRYGSAGELARALALAVNTSTNASDKWYEYDMPFLPPEAAEATTPIVLHNQAAQAAQEVPSADVYSAKTEEGPRVQPAYPPDLLSLEAKPTFITTPAPHPQPMQAPDYGLAEQATQKDASHYPKRTHRRPFAMLILGGFIALTFIVSSFAVYPHFTHKSPTLTTKGTSTVTARPFVAPAPVVTPAGLGRLLYATPRPGTSCDTYGGQWSAQSNAALTCQSNAVELANKGGSTPAAIFLNTLPKKVSIPDNYMLQVQVALSPNSRDGDFGVLFRTQSSPQRGGYSFLISPSGYWNGNAYDNTTGTIIPFYGRQGTVAINGTITIDILVRGNTYTLYLNGVQQGGIQSSTYMNGTLGLLTTGGAQVYFKNLELYALT